MEELIGTQEKRLRENGYFLYQVCHFKPVRQFMEKDGNFFEKTRRLRHDDKLGMMVLEYKWYKLNVENLIK